MYEEPYPIRHYVVSDFRVEEAHRYPKRHRQKPYPCRPDIDGGISDDTSEKTEADAKPQWTAVRPLEFLWRFGGHCVIAANVRFGSKAVISLGPLSAKSRH